MEHHVIIGIHSVTTALEESPEKVSQLWLLQNNHNKKHETIQLLAEQYGIKTIQLNKKKFEELFSKNNHQGVALTLKQTSQTPIIQDFNQLKLFIKNTTPNLILILDNITDPHNLGACLRTACAANVDAVIIPKDNSAPINATVSKVACGALSHLSIFKVSNLAQTITWLKTENFWIYGTGKFTSSQSIYQTDLSNQNIVLIMGAEDKGLRRLTKEHCDQLIDIPMPGSMESLNVSVATGICLFEIVRQKTKVS